MGSIGLCLVPPDRQVIVFVRMSDRAAPGGSDRADSAGPGGVNGPADTDVALLIVVSGSTSVARLSHDFSWADT